MATATPPEVSSDGSTTLSERSEEYLRLSRSPYEFHRAVYHNDITSVREMLERGKDIVNIQDCFGNTPLHIAVMLGYKDIVKLLLEHKASAKEKNLSGWSSLNEAISYGSREIISLLLKRLHDEMKEGLIERRFQLIKALKNLDDFYAELKWEFHTWVPLLSRLLPNDICRIYKTGCSIRLDSTLGDFTEMQWTRGDISFVYNGEDMQSSHTLSIVALDNVKKYYQRLSLNSGEDLDGDMENHVDLLMTKPIVYANMSTQPITVSRAQSGFLFFRADKTEQVGEYLTDVYNITDLILISRKRREHLTPEQVARFEELTKQIEQGDIPEEMIQANDGDDVEEVSHCPSLPPPPPTTDITCWEDYLSSPLDKPPHLGREIDLKIDRKNFKASVCMTQECPIEMKKLLDILEVLTPFKHFYKLRQFVNLKLPPGFPVKVEIPVFPMVTATISLQHYEHRQFSLSKFLIPRDYKKYTPRKDDSNSSEDMNT